jgi:hypothetical protein
MRSADGFEAGDDRATCPMSRRVETSLRATRTGRPAGRRDQALQRDLRRMVTLSPTPPIGPQYRQNANHRDR